MTSGSKVAIDLGIIGKLKDKFEQRVVEGEYIPLGDVDNFFRVHEVKVPSVNYLIAAVIGLQDFIERNKANDDFDCSNDLVNQPSHYRVNEKECIVEMLILFGTENFVKYCTFNAWKYRYRAGNKGDATQDLKKSDRYIEYAYRASRIELWNVSPNKLTDDAWWAERLKNDNTY